jgi:hypothetical protein
MPPFRLDPDELNVFAEFAPSDTSQVRRAAGSVTSSADFQDFLNQNGGAAGVLKKCCRQFI